MQRPWPAENTTMAGRIRTFPWVATALGAPSQWPATLRTAVELMLASPHPAYVGWGPELLSFYNDLYAPILGAKFDSGLAVPYFDLWPELREEFTPLVAQTLSGIGQHFVDRPVALEGREHQTSWFTFSWTPLRDDSGIVQGFYCAAFETTEKVQAANERHRAEEAALRATELRYRTLFSSIDEGFCLIEVKFDEQQRPIDYRFLEVNPAFEKHTGLVDATGHWMSDLTPEHEQRWYDIYGQVAMTGEPTRFIEHAEALGRWFNVYAFRFGQPEDRAVAVLFEDITQRHEAEEALRRADRRKDEFLATLAHELRNPLAALAASAQLLSKASQKPDVVVMAREALNRQVEHMSRLLDDLLDIARITNNLVQLKLKRLSVVDAIHAAVETARPQIDAKSHRLTLHLTSTPAFVDADAVRLSQIISNLLSNSAKYTTAHGQIDVFLEVKVDHAIVRVRDNGAGIAPEMLPRVFDMFWQERRSSQAPNSGLGIGLALVKALVDLHHGTISVESSGPGQGSEFSLCLPLASTKSHDAAMGNDDGATSNTPPLKILIADDNVDSARGWAMMLEQAGHDVRTTFDGRMALDEAQRFHPQVMLLDIGMPQLDGYQVAEHVRGTEWGSEATLVAITGWGQVQDRQRATAAGFDYHFTKPADIRDVQAVLRKAGARLS